MRTLIISAFILLAFSSAAMALDISVCTNLNSANTVYDMTANVTAAGSCMNVTANNVTLDCHGYKINYSQTSSGYGVNNAGGYDNIIIRNCIVLSGSATDGPAIYFSGSENGIIANSSASTKGVGNDAIVLSTSTNITIRNCTSSTAASNAAGIWLTASANNNFIDNNSITTTGGARGITVSASSGNSFTKNYIETSNTMGAGIYLISSSHNSTIIGNFINTTGQSSHGIWFVDGLNETLADNVIYTKQYDSCGILLKNTSSATVNNCTASVANLTAYALYFYNNSDNVVVSNSTFQNIAGYSIAFINQSVYYAENVTIYNCLINSSSGYPPIGFTYTGAPNYFNTTNQTGTRRYSGGNFIGGNYYTNSAGTGFSDTCPDSNTDGFCNSYYDVLDNNACTGGDCSGYTDYLPYSNLGTTYNVYWSSNSTNSTLAGTQIEHRVKWDASNPLSGYIFYFNNGSNWTDYNCADATGQTTCESYGCAWNGTMVPIPVQAGSVASASSGTIDLTEPAVGTGRSLIPFIGSDYNADSTYTIEVTVVNSTRFTWASFNDLDGALSITGDYLAFSDGSYPLDAITNMECQYLTSVAGASSGTINTLNNYGTSSYSVQMLPTTDDDGNRLNTVSKTATSFNWGGKDDAGSAELQLTGFYYCVIPFGVYNNSGVMIMAGNDTLGSTATTTKAITLPGTMPDANYAVIATAYASGAADYCEIEVSGKTTASFNVTGEDDDTTNNCGSRGFDYIIVSYGYGVLNNGTPCNGTSNYEYKADSWTAMGGTLNWSNITKWVNTTEGATIKWKVWANDTYGISNLTDEFSYLTEGAGVLAGALGVEMSWPVPGLSLNVAQNQTFRVNASVTCTGEDESAICGDVTGRARYNLSISPDTDVNTSDADIPLFTLSGNPQDCGSMAYGDSCNLSWLVNATGDIGSIWAVDVLFESSEAGVENNETEDSNVSISGCSIDVTLDFDAVLFSNATYQPYPNTYGNPAINNSLSFYNITVNPGSCALDIYTRATDLLSVSIGSSIGMGNMTFSSTAEDYPSSTRYSSDYQLLNSNVGPGTEFTNWFWLDLPPVYYGLYNGSVYISSVVQGENP